MRVCLEQQRDLEPMIEQKVFSSRVKTFILTIIDCLFFFERMSAAGKRGQTNKYFLGEKARAGKQRVFVHVVENLL